MMVTKRAMVAVDQRHTIQRGYITAQARNTMEKELSKVLKEGFTTGQQMEREYMFLRLQLTSTDTQTG